MEFKTYTNYNGTAMTEYMHRSWERNGPGPKVPHQFDFRWAEVVSSAHPSITGLLAGYSMFHYADLDWSVGENRLHGKLKDKAFEGLQLGADYGERKQAITLIGTALQAVIHPLRTVANIMKQAAKNRKGILTGVLGDSAQAFLAFRYGVLPLIGTIKGATEALTNPSPTQRVKSKVSLRKSTSGVDEWTGRSHIVTMRGGITSGFQILVENPMLHAMDRTGLINPASIAWELMPMSFVFDWFLPIGSLINSWSDFAGTERVSPYLTRFQKTEYWQWDRDGVLEMHDRAVWCNRSLVAPEFTLGGMRFKTEMSRQHIENALALITALAAKSRIPYK